MEKRKIHEKNAKSVNKLKIHGKKRKIHEKNENFKILQLQPWDLAQKIGLDLRIPDHTLTSLCDL